MIRTANFLLIDLRSNECSCRVGACSGRRWPSILEWTPAALHDEIERLELASRALDARRLAARAAAESRQTPALDGHKSTQAYLRATCNQPSYVALGEVRRARICRDFPEIGEALMAGRIGVGQIDELVRIKRNERAAKYLDQRRGRDVARACRAFADSQLCCGCRALVDVGRSRRRVARSDRVDRPPHGACRGRQR